MLLVFVTAQPPPGLTVSYNTIDGAGAGNGSALVGAAGAGTTTLTYNWLKHFPQRVLEINTATAPYSVLYKYNLIERGALEWLIPLIQVALDIVCRAI